MTLALITTEKTERVKSTLVYFALWSVKQKKDTLQLKHILNLCFWTKLKQITRVPATTCLSNSITFSRLLRTWEEFIHHLTQWSCLIDNIKKIMFYTLCYCVWKPTESIAARHSKFILKDFDNCELFIIFSELDAYIVLQQAHCNSIILPFLTFLLFLQPWTI